MAQAINRTNISKTEKDDQKISIALMASFVILSVQYFLLIYFNLLETPNASRVQLISKVIVGLIFLYALPVVIEKSKLKLIGSYFIGIFIFLLHYLLFPGNGIEIGELIFPFFFMCLPSFVYSISIRNISILKLYMKKASFFVFIIATALSVLVFFGKATVGAYSMTLSYYMLLPMIVYTDELFDNPSLKAILFTAIALLIILSLGSRGPVLCIIAFLLLKFAKSLSRLSYTRILYVLLLLTTGFMVFIYLDSILQYSNNLLLNLGIKSRTIALFLMGGVYLSGRENIYQLIIKAITDNPVLGIGIAGDRLLIGGYAHNLLLEVLVDFGLIIGSILIVTLLLLIAKNLLTKDSERYNMIIIWISLGLVPLIVSGSYLTNTNFWILLGLMASNVLSRNNKIRDTARVQSRERIRLIEYPNTGERCT